MPRRSARSTSPAILSVRSPGGFAAGKSAREKAPRSSHAAWSPPADRPDPIALLRHDDIDRLPELLPIRYGRMAQTPFTFFRGSASIMANDLQYTPSSGIHTQICGDAHLSNFGAYASPERRLVFDINDFDESVAGGAWEWDLKRLAVSFAVAGRAIGLRANDVAAAVRACLQNYRKRMHDFAQMNVLDIWYARIDEQLLLAAIGDAEAGAAGDDELSEPSHTAEHLYPKLVDVSDGTPRIVHRPPLLFHPTDDPDFIDAVRTAFEHYHRSLPTDRRQLVERFTFADASYKVVGVGSVGTRCCVALFTAGANDSIFLQLKEARTSVYEPFVSKCEFADHGERVVAGQHLMQSATDLFLGWGRDGAGRTFYVRQLRDMKTSAEVDLMGAPELRRYAALCGWALARAHAKASGRAAEIAGYLGKGESFDVAMGAFANAYADQNERDFAALKAAITDGRVVAAAEAPS